MGRTQTLAAQRFLQQVAGTRSASRSASQHVKRASQRFRDASKRRWKRFKRASQRFGHASKLRWKRFQRASQRFTHSPFVGLERVVRGEAGGCACAGALPRSPVHAPRSDLQKLAEACSVSGNAPGTRGCVPARVQARVEASVAALQARVEASLQACAARCAAFQANVPASFPGLQAPSRAVSSVSTHA